MKKQNIIDFDEIFKSAKDSEKNEQKDEMEQLTDEVASFIKEFAKGEGVPVSKIKTGVIKKLFKIINQRFNAKNDKRKRAQKIFLAEMKKMLNKKLL